MKKRIAITCGDPDGIGPEVTVKALLAKNHPGLIPLIFRAPENEKIFRRLEGKYRRFVVADFDEALTLEPPARSVIEIVDGSAAPFWVFRAAEAAMRGRIDGMVTGPLSKTLIRRCGFREIGHTEILARVSKRNELFQAYLGNRFNVVLATAHVPLAQVPGTLRKGAFRASIVAAEELRQRLPGAMAGRPLAILGLNPHAGEDGLLGKDEVYFRRQIASLGRKGIPLEGPLVPDAAFSPSLWKKYSIFVAAYHDQGLIPFKMVHGRRTGTHLTLGLPFIRTSVDHGTAKDIAGRWKADPGSMKDAIDWCLRLC